jgi:hypothetical protein
MTSMKFAKGTKVRFVRRNDSIAKGTVTKTIEMANGTWCLVDCGDLGTIKARPSQLKRV